MMRAGIRTGIRRVLNLALRRRDRWEREVEDEIKLHLTLRAEELVARGATPDDAYAEAIRRFGNPEPVAGLTMIGVAAAGIIVNGVTAWMFASGRHGDLNIRGAFLHMAADAAVSAGVVVAGVVILRTGWLLLDPISSLVIVVIILIGTWGLLRDSVGLALDAVPRGIDPGAVKSFLEQLPGVAEIHHLHVWGLSTTETACTAHVVKREPQLDDQLLKSIAHELHERFGIEHTTIQFECAGGPDCPTEHEPETHAAS